MFNPAKDIIKKIKEQKKKETEESHIDNEISKNDDDDDWLVASIRDWKLSWGGGDLLLILLFFFTDIFYISSEQIHFFKFEEGRFLYLCKYLFALASNNFIKTLLSNLKWICFQWMDILQNSFVFSTSDVLCKLNFFYGFFILYIFI